MRNRFGKREGNIRPRMRLTLSVIAVCCAAMLIMPTGIARERSISIGEVRSSSLVEVQALEAASATGTAAFLKDSGFIEAWSAISADVTTTIAVVDTGVDFNHPGLKPFLLPGKNLVNTNRQPQDDNGHGTAVAGIIAAVASAGEASGKVKWKGRILPIKALDQNGSGDESKLTQAINYAVAQGADIIVLSLGLRRDAPKLREAVAEAESKGVLLVAASGNDAATLGSKAAVQYPAAYASVLAVSGSEVLKPVSQSTSGPEIDLSASWSVDTLAIGGGRATMVGSSMGAPQVAAAAAMLMAAHPDWKPVQVREALRGAALKSGSADWNANIGYGFLSANNAVRMVSVADWREPNDARDQASTFPLGKEVAGAWSSQSDVDWYTIDIPYGGTLTISKDTAQFSLFGGNPSSVELDQSDDATPGVVQWLVPKGRYWLKVSKAASGKIGLYPGYRLTSGFEMNADAREPNDSATTAFTLPPRTQQWTGTFHQRNDEDWTTVNVPKDGELALSATTDTARIDLALMIQPAGGAMTIVDERGDGGSEQLIIKQAKAGKYYIRITNAVSANPEPVIGTYTASLEYITQYEDPYEPNNSPVTATPLSYGERYEGLVNPDDDVDWYRFTLSERKKIQLSFGGIADGTVVTVALRDRKQQTLNTWRNAKDNDSLAGERVLEPGTYYMSIEADRAEPNQAYHFIMQAEATQDPFSDLTGYRWASPSIQSLVKAGWVNGYPDGQFRPGASLSRGEAIATLVRAFDLKKPSATMRFQDIAPRSWLYDPVVKADQAGWLASYTGGQLQPATELTRAEAAKLFATALKLDLPQRPKQVFKDIPAKDELAAIVEALKEGHWLSGYPDGNFKPDATITRAEWSVLLAKLLEHKA
ncbi:S8 family serine peptidase [Cohnella yongneupensis]|uniref:S8 family serine peptidase n=1 Tax=Cohnella yongneupensis TaxID=425006 RepID=A0ABW0R1Y6_9BACL